MMIVGFPLQHCLSALFHGYADGPLPHNLTATKPRFPTFEKEKNLPDRI